MNRFFVFLSYFGRLPYRRLDCVLRRVLFAFVRTTNNNSEVAILNSMKPHQAMGDSLCYDYLDDTIGVNQLLSMRFLPMARFYEPKYDIMLRAHSTIWRSYQDCQGLAEPSGYHRKRTIVYFFFAISQNCD